MSLDNLLSRDFQSLEFPADGNMVYVIGIMDNRKGFFPFYVGKTRRLVGRMGDYDNAHFDPLPDFHVGQAIKYFHFKKCKVEVKYKLSKAMSAEEREWKKTIQGQLGAGFRLLDESVFELTNYDDQDQHLNKVREFCDEFLKALDNAP